MSSIEINTSESEADPLVPVYNIHSRPKRAIHFEPITTSGINLEIADDSDESDDEDFMPDESLEEELERKSNTESDNSNNDYETETKIEEKPVVSESANKSNSSTIVKKKRKYKKRKQSNFFGDPQSDEETKKILNSFRSPKIVIKKTKKATTKKLNSKIKKRETTSNQNPDLKVATETVKVCSGPFVRRVESTTIPMYIVHQSHSVHESKFDIESNTKKNLVVREKAPPITDHSIPWVCSLCHIKPNAINGLGGLFGPYRVSLNELDEDQTIEYKADNKVIKVDPSDSIFREIWLHEGCAVWTPNLYFLQNKIKGIWTVLESSSKLKCISCKKNGASLMCNKHGCQKVFHFPCAVLNEAYFNQNNFTIFCKKHKTSG